MALPATTNETWNELWTLSMRAEGDGMADAIFEVFEGLNWFRKNAMETEVGKELQEDIEYAKQTGTWFGKNQTLPTSWSNTVTAAFYQWAYFAVPIVIDITEEQENLKPRGARKLLAQRTSNAMKSARNAISTALFSAKTGKSMLGLQDIISTTNDSGTLGGLSKTHSWWQNVAYSTTVDVDSASAGIYAGFQRFNLLNNQASSGNDSIDAIFVDETRYGDLQNVLNGSNYARTVLGNENSPGTPTPAIGRAKILMDRDMPSGYGYGINKGSMGLKVQTGLNFAKTPFRSPHNQLVKIGFIVIAVQLTANNIKRNWVASDLQ